MTAADARRFAEAVRALASPDDHATLDDWRARAMAARHAGGRTAAALGVSESVARYHTERVLRRLGVRSHRLVGVVRAGAST